jgi:hypothetical protein
MAAWWSPGASRGYDQTYLADALEKLGPRFAGVAQVPPEIADEDVLVLARVGARAFPST